MYQPYSKHLQYEIGCYLLQFNLRLPLEHSETQHSTACCKCTLMPDAGKITPKNYHSSK